VPNSGGMHSFDSALYYTQYGEPRPSPTSYLNLITTWTEVAEVVTINGVAMDRSVTELTHLRSPNKAKEKVPGFLDGGQVTLKLNYKKGSPTAPFTGMAHVQALSPGGAIAGEAAPGWGRLTWAVAFPDHGMWVFTGFIKSTPVEIPEDNRVTVEATIEISGKPSFYAFA
jgi:hypothetical protein